MNKETFEKAKKLEAELKEVNQQIDYWNKATSIHSISVIGKFCYGVENIKPEYINFSNLKIQVLATLQAKRVQLKEEFKSLQS